MQRCLECHGADPKGGLDLRSGPTALAGGKDGVVLLPGDPEGSLLYQHVLKDEMPPKKPLPQAEKDALRQWIADGAWFPETSLDLFAATSEKRGGYDWWSLQPLRDVSPPELQAPAPERAGLVSRWQANPIDRFVFAKLQEQRLLPSPETTPRAYIRRVSYDVTGLPPTPEEVTEFEAACAAETGATDTIGDRACEVLIDRLLASPHFGERWGRHWLDVVRFGESTGYEVNHIIDNLWPYRDYVIQSFNEDKPYDRFVREQLAADSLDPGNPETEIGLAFLVCGPYDIVGNLDPAQAAQIRANGVDEYIRAATESFLGLTVGCARCHDHKFDAISQRDYYQFYATFAGVYNDDREVATGAQRQARDAQIKPLREARDALAAQLGELEAAVLARAQGKAAEYDARWPRPPVDRRGTTEEFAPVRARFLRFISEGRDNDPNGASGYRLDEFEVWTADETPRNVAAAVNGGKASGASSKPGDFSAAYTADLTIDGKFDARWLAGSRELTLEFAQEENIQRVVFSSDRTAAVSVDSPEAPFPCEYRIEISQDGDAWLQVADSYDRQPLNEAHRNKRYKDWEFRTEEQARLLALSAQWAEADSKLNQIPPLPVMRVGRLEQPTEVSRIFGGGDPQRPLEEIAPASMKTLERAAGSYTLAPDAPEKERRLALANWITAPENPLPARVMVNRIWHYHFGTGIVSTPSDFGFMGDRPSHPELLDWLARELQHPTEAAPDQAWRMKRIHKLILMSQTYRQSSAYRADAAAVDGDARLLWRFPPRRLSGEELRDTMLAVAGKLDTTMGGPGYRLYNYLRDNVSTYVPLEVHPPETYRRAVYHENVRASRVDVLTDFDSPDCAMAAPRRANTTSPLQALTLMNHTFTIDMAEQLAARVAAETGGVSVQEAVRRACALAFSREPAPAELDASVDFIKAEGLAAYCRALLNTNELIYVD
ncbi:MAG: DUF1553 domain-containing protein [Candidatus Hydrogenedentes bacterium]|nr:DUF1553 domain-containing protein [Candidatus Hydrogenedentota bacterium]